MFNLSNVVKGEYTDAMNENLWFKTTSVKKVVILSILTCGLYQVVWFYNYWKTLEIKFGYKLSPFWRALFGGITCFWLFPILEKYVDAFKQKTFSGITYAILYLLLNFIYGLNGVLCLIGFLQLVIIADIQNRINEINAQYYPMAENNKWSVANTLWSLPFGILIFLFILGIIIEISHIL